MNDVPPAYLAAAATAACGLYACCKAPPGPSASELTPPDAELKPEAIAALSTVPENLAGVYDYDGKTGAFKLEHSEAGVPYNKTEKETMVAKASLSLKAARYACSLSLGLFAWKDLAAHARRWVLFRSIKPSFTFAFDATPKVVGGINFAGALTVKHTDGVEFTMNVPGALSCEYTSQSPPHLDFQGGAGGARA